MTKHEISKALTKTVRLGSQRYGATLTVTATGSVYPAPDGANAVFSSVTGVNLTNDGHIIGGFGDANPGGIGVDLTAGGTITNAYFISGGRGTAMGGAGVDLAHGGTLDNTDYILGGSAGTAATDVAGDGVVIAKGALSNMGTIAGGYDENGGSGTAGVGVDVTKVSEITNSGTIVGGYSEYGHAGAGLVMKAAGLIVNSGYIVGGNAYSYHRSGVTGIGVDILAGGTLTNSGTIAGGDIVPAYPGGVGADAVDATSATIVNSGFIYGGSATGGGGAGVSLNGGTLTNTGTISGGAIRPHGLGDAVDFGTLAATLEVSSTAVFFGQVAADTAVNDGLILDAGAPGTLSGLGTQFTGFTTVQDNGQWVLKGANTLSATSTLAVENSLDVMGKFNDAGTENVVVGTLAVTGTGTAQLASIILAATGTLSVGATAALVVGTSTAGATAGVITLDAGVPIMGQGTIGDAHAIGITDNAAIIVSTTGTLSLVNAVTGTGTITLDAFSVLNIQAGLHTPSLVFSGGNDEFLNIAKGASVTSTLSGFSGTDMIDEKQLSITSVSFSNGTLNLLDGKTNVGTLFLAGSYNTDSFGLVSDNAGGTTIYLTGQDFAAEHAPQDDRGWATLIQNPGTGLMAALLGHGGWHQV